MVKPSTSSSCSSGSNKSDRRCGAISGRYKGVRMRKWGKWVAEVRQPNSRDRIWLGSYDSPDEAARAYDAAVFCLRGPSALLNFPHSPPDIPSATDLSPSQIQEAALTHARRNRAADIQPAEEEEKHGKLAPAMGDYSHGGGSSDFGISVREAQYSYSPSSGGASAEHRVEEESRITSGVYYQLPHVWSF